MKISQKLIIGFVGIALMSGLSGGVVVIRDRALREIAEHGIYDSVFLMRSAWQMMEMFEHQEIAAKHYLLFKTREKEEYLSAKERSKEAYENLDRYIRKQPAEAEKYIRPLAEKFRENLRKYQIEIEETFNFSDQGADRTVIMKKDKEADKFIEIAHEEAMIPIIGYITDKRVKPAMKNIVREINNTTAVIIVMSFVALSFAVGVGLFISRIIYVPIRKLEKAATEIGKGKWDTKIDIFSNDELGELAVFLRKMAGDLKNITVSVIELNAEIAKRKETQFQLVQSEKLASIGQLAAGIAHEINNPIGFIKSNLNTFEKYHKELMADKKTKSGYMAEDMNNLITETKEGVDRISKIVKDLKNFSRKDEGVKTPSDLNEVLEGILGIVWNEIKYKAELKKDYGKIPSIKCSVQQIGQVFVNLLLNAVQAIEEKGIITIRTYLRENLVCVDVSDTGRGIPRDDIPKIFDPFFTTKEKDKGTGLGLSISYDIVKRHNGHIDVESEVGKGTKFTVCLPV